VILAAQLNEEVTGKEEFQHPLRFAANQSFTDELRAKRNVVLLQKVDSGPFILAGLALQ
jgi:hypothetical protein